MAGLFTAEQKAKIKALVKRGDFDSLVAAQKLILSRLSSG